MAMTLATAYIDIIPSMGPKGRMGKDIAREFAGVERHASSAGKGAGGKFSSAFKGSMAGIAGAFAAVGIGSFVKDAIKSAGDIEQSFGAIESVFKGSSDQMKTWSRKAAKDVGLTSNEFNELGTLIGSQLKNGGTAMDELAPKTKNLIGVGADLASMFGGTTKEAIEAMSSALRGESDPIERYGVSLSAARIEAKALEQGAKKVGGELSQQAKQTAILALITEQTADAQGNFARESDTFAHKQQVMAAEWGNLTTKIGELFLPTLTTAFAFISDKVIPVFTEGVGGVRAFGAAFKAADGDITSNGFPGFMERMAAGAHGLHDLLIKGDYRGLLHTAFGWEEDSPIVGFVLDLRDGVIEAKDSLKDAGDWVVKNKDWLLTLAVAIGSVVVAYKTYTTAIAIHTAAMAIYTTVSSIAGGAQAFFAGAAFTAALGVTALNTALKANVFGIIALAVIGLVSGLVYFFTQTEAGKAIVAAAWEGIQKVIGGVVDWFQNTLLPITQDVFRTIGEVIGNVVEWVKNNWPLLLTILAGPIGAAIAWIIKNWSGIVAFFQGVFAKVGAVFNWFYLNVVTPVFDGISSAVAAVVAVFQGIALFLQPVFDSIGVILNGFYLGARGIFQLVSSIITYVVIPLFMGFWNRIVEVFTGIGKTISDWWNGAVAVFNTVVTFVRAVLAAVFTWYLNNVIKPVWNGVTGAIKTAWTNISNVFNTIVSFIRTVLSAAFTWLRDSVIKPVFTGIGNAISWVWNNVLKPMFNAWVSLFRDVLGPAFTWLYKTVIKPAFDGIGAGIKYVWEKVIKPVFETIKTFITKTIPKAFEDGVKFVKTAWDKIQDIAKAPIRFVIDTVINDGLINAFNTIAGVLPGIDKLPRVALPKGFADGGYTGDGGKYQPAGIVHAGEYVFTKEQTRKAGIGNLAAMAKSLTGYAKGGLVHPLPNSVTSSGFGPREGGFHNGIDFAAPTGTPVRAAGKGRVSQAAWSPFGGGNEIHIDHPNGLQTWYAHLSSFAVKAGQMVNAGNRIGAVGSTGNSTGPHLHYMVLNGGWPNFTNPSGYLAGGGDIPAGGTPWNPLSGIVDGLVSTFKDKFPGGGMIADMAIGVGKKILDSTTKWVTDKLSGHSEGSAYGPTVYDGGGWLENTGGAQLVQHNKRKPDAVLSSSQWDTMTRIADNSRGAGVTFTGPVHVRDENELASIISTRQRDAQAAYGF